MTKIKMIENHEWLCWDDQGTNTGRVPCWLENNYLTCILIRRCVMSMSVFAFWTHLKLIVTLFERKKILKANDCGQRRGHCPLDSGVMAAQLTVTNFSHLAAICFSAWYTTLKKKTRMWCCAVAAPFLRSDLPLIPVCPKDKLHKRLVSELICVLYILGNGTCSFPFVNYIWH